MNQSDLSIEWAVEYEDKMTVYMDGTKRMNHLIQPSREQAEAALEIMVERRHHSAYEGARVVYRFVTDWRADGEE